MIRKRRRGGYNTHTGLIVPTTKIHFELLTVTFSTLELKFWKTPKMDFPNLILLLGGGVFS